ADVDLVPDRVVADVQGAFAHGRGRQDAAGRGVEDDQAAAVGVGAEQACAGAVQRDVHQERLGAVQGETAQNLAAVRVDDGHAVVAALADVQAVRGGVVGRAGGPFAQSGQRVQDD